MPRGIASIPWSPLAFDLSHDASVYAKWGHGLQGRRRQLTFAHLPVPSGPNQCRPSNSGPRRSSWTTTSGSISPAYTAEYKDVQVDFNALLPGVNRTTIETTNADGARRSKGIEMQLAVTPLSGLTWGRELRL